MRSRWVALVFVALAQLMAALDATIVNVALPSAQGALDFTDAQRQWVVTAYTLPFAAFVLLGGRIADQFGRRRAFVAGLLGFAASSALAGAAGSLALLAAARGLQGLFAALLAPTALSLLATMFTDAAERAKAFAVYGAIAGSGGALGLVLGGVLAEYASWRWCLFVNVPVACLAAVGGRLTLPAGGPARRHRLDLPGALLSTGGLVALVQACTEAVSRGWGATPVVALLATSAALLGAFAWRESRAAEPLLPPRIVRDRTRAGAYLSVALALAGMLGLFLFLTYYLQAVLGWSPLEAGLAFLPLSVAVQVGAVGIARRLAHRVAPRALIVPGLLAAAAAMLLLTRLDADSGYLSIVLPAELLLGVGMGCVFVPAIAAATQGVDPREAGVAAAVVNASQQAGGSVGTALLNTIAAGAAVAVDGYASAAGWAAGILGVAAVLAAVLLGPGRRAMVAA